MDLITTLVWRNELDRRLDASMAQHRREQAHEHRSAGSVARPSRSRDRDRTAAVAVGSTLAPQS